MPSRRGVKSRWTSATKAQVRQMVDNGISDGDIARAYGVDRTTILRLRHQLERTDKESKNEPEHGTVEHLMWRANVERGYFERLDAAFNDDDDAIVNLLWDELFALRQEWKYARES